MPAASSFDPVRYKATTREQWQGAAGAWNAWGSTLHDWLGEATQRMLDMAHVESGAQVLDVAAGAGEQTLAAAERVGASGRVLATDISPKILEHARANAHAAGYPQVETLVLDGEELHSLPERSFDAVISRVGLIYFPDQQRALQGMLRALKPGGRVAAITYSTAERNGFFSVPVSIIRKRAALPPPLPGQPGPFSLGTPEVLSAALERAGFVDVAVEQLDAPLRLGSAADCVRFERESFGALQQMLGSLGEPEREQVWAEIEEALGSFESAGGFVGPCELLIGAATRAAD